MKKAYSGTGSILRCEQISPNLFYSNQASHTESGVVLELTQKSVWLFEGTMSVQIIRMGSGACRLIAKKVPANSVMTVSIEERTNKIQRDLEQAEVKNLFEKLEALTIPAAPMDKIIFEGDYTELRMGGYKGRATYRWWDESPKGWENLERLTKYVLDLSGIGEKRDHQVDVKSK